MARPTDPAGAERDRSLVGRVSAGDERALAELYDRHGGSLYAVAFRVLGTTRDAEEAVTEAFAQAWRESSRFDAGWGSVAAWLVTIIRARSLDAARGTGRRPQPAVADPRAGSGAGAGTPEGMAVFGERHRLVREAVDQLTPAQREAIEMALYGGLTQSEIADQLQVPPGTVKSRLRLGMQKLRETLGPLTEEPS
jgi:RNA polymerase sigma-70 factor (ECF subfamily)